MEWIRISSNKLKIMLSAEDARHYALDQIRTDHADGIDRTILREILEDVREQADFDVGDDRIYIQLYPSKEGGCELFVTRMGLMLTDSESLPQTGTAHSCQTTLKAPKRPATGQEKKYALPFSDFGELLSLCRRLQTFFVGESTLWQQENGIWWLFVTQSGMHALSARFLREYTQPASAQRLLTLLPEHGTLICEKNAVQRLAEL